MAWHLPVSGLTGEAACLSRRLACRYVMGTSNRMKWFLRMWHSDYEGRGWWNQRESRSQTNAFCILLALTRKQRGKTKQIAWCTHFLILSVFRLSGSCSLLNESFNLVFLRCSPFWWITILVDSGGVPRGTLSDSVFESVKYFPKKWPLIMITAYKYFFIYYLKKILRSKFNVEFTKKVKRGLRYKESVTGSEWFVYWNSRSSLD